MEVLKNITKNKRYNLFLFQRKNDRILGLDLLQKTAKERVELNQEFLEGMGTFYLKSKFLKIAPSFPYQGYQKLYHNYKYQGIITGVYKDKLSGNANLLIDLGLKEDLIVLKEAYDRNLNLFKVNKNLTNVIVKLNIKQKKRISITNFEKNGISIYLDSALRNGYNIRYFMDKLYKLELGLVKSL